MVTSVNGQKGAVTNIATTSEVDALETRIDNIVAPSGDPSLTEVSDARVGANSTVYSTLKGRIDGEVNELNERLEEQNSVNDYVLEGEYNAKLAFRSGTTLYYEIGEQLNAFIESNSRQRTDVIEAPLNTKISVSINGNYNVRILNANTNGIITEASDYVNEYTFICDGQFVLLIRDSTNPNADISNVSIAQYINVVYDDFYLSNKIEQINQNTEQINQNTNAIFNGNYNVNENWFIGTLIYYEPGYRIDQYTASGTTAQTRKRTNAIETEIGSEYEFSVSGNYLIRVYNAGSDGIITSVSEYSKTVKISCQGMYAIVIRSDIDGTDISNVNPSEYVTINKVTAIKKLQSEISNFNIDKIIPVTQSVPATAEDYYSLWETLVLDGYCSKEQIATVDNQPIYRYIISKDNDTLSGDSLRKVSDGSYYSKPKISMISGVHGDEKGSPLFLYEFINRMCRNLSYGKYIGMYDFYIIPLVNPTGYNNNIRENYHNININRDATENPVTVEGQALKTHFDSNDWACCFDFHQMSHGHGTSGFTYSCGYMALFNGASDAVKDKFSKLFTEVGYETELLMQKYTGKSTHAQMFHMWEWVENYNNWTNYPVNVVHKTDASFIVETAQTWYYYSGSGVDLNQIALNGGNTFTDKVIKILLENV